MSGRRQGRKPTTLDEQDEREERGTVILPFVTLPSLPRIESARQASSPAHRARNGQTATRMPATPPPSQWDDNKEYDSDLYDDEPEESFPDTWDDEDTALPVVAAQNSLVARKPVPSRMLTVLLIPGKGLTKRATRGLAARPAASGAVAQFVRAHRPLLVALTTLVVMSATLMTITGAGFVGSWSTKAWSAVSGAGPAPTATPIPAPDVTDAAHYVNKYGFDWPGGAQALPDDERQRMVFMLPYAYRATAAYDDRYHASIEPEMIVWWTHAEGIGARINYSNCANNPPRPGTDYFSNIENCPQANFWQLGYGNQFSVIYVLKDAFTDLYGNPNDPRLVQKVGQWVLDFDAKQGTVPACGGYSCTFPAMTIDQIMSGVNQATGIVNADNWWASVLSRDPAINCYMIAHALTFFNHEATRNWIGCYYYEPCWGYESNRLGDILAAWPSLRSAAGL